MHADWSNVSRHSTGMQILSLDGKSYEHEMVWTCDFAVPQ